MLWGEDPVGAWTTAQCPEAASVQVSSAWQSQDVEFGESKGQGWGTAWDEAVRGNGGLGREK